MTIVQISKIQMRRGPSSDLPNPGLDDGEFGFTTDIGRLFIGQNSPTNGQPNYARSSFPYQNVEVLTENSPLGTIMQPVIADNRYGFIKSVPLMMTASFVNFQTYVSGSAQDFYVNTGLGVGANATIYYHVVDPANNPIRVGRLHVLWNTESSGEPLCSDESEVADGSVTDIQWKAVLTGSVGTQHVVLQYTNARSDTPAVFFRIDRPVLS